MNDNDFFSIDKLVEFGMSMAVANQMVQSMNQTLKQMDVPGKNTEIQKKPDELYYVVIDGKQSGSYSLTELSRLITEKKVTKSSYI